jgi:hypothetical protein
MKNLNSKVTMIGSYALYSREGKLNAGSPLLGYTSVESG